MKSQRWFTELGHVTTYSQEIAPEEIIADNEGISDKELNTMISDLIHTAVTSQVQFLAANKNLFRYAIASERMIQSAVHGIEPKNLNLHDTIFVRIENDVNNTSLNIRVPVYFYTMADDVKVYVKVYVFGMKNRF